MFTNAQRLAKTLPGYLEPPSDKELAKVGPQSTVKICAGNDRFWVIVERVIDGRIEGYISTKPEATQDHGLSLYDRVRFKHEHIYQIWRNTN